MLTGSGAVLRWQVRSCVDVPYLTRGTDQVRPDRPCLWADSADEVVVTNGGPAHDSDTSSRRTAVSTDSTACPPG